MSQEQWNSKFKGKTNELPQADNWNLEFDDNIVPNSPSGGWQQYMKKANARFACTSCRRRWPSNRVMVLFNMRLEYGNGTVKVRRFRQSCNRCTDAPMVTPEMEGETIDVVLDKLIEKIRIKIYKEDLGEQPRFFNNYEVNNPHEPSNCEGCRNGICIQ